MRSVESEGDTIDLAIENALQALGVGRDQVEIEIVEDASKGLFGFGGKKARVRATLRAPLGSGVAAAPIDPRSDSRETSIAPDRREPMPRVTPRPVNAGASAQLGERSRALLGELLVHLGVTCTIDVRPGEEDGVLVLDVSGDSGGLLIGRRGQTLDALEYMVNRIAGRGEEEQSGRVVLDVEHYRERRREYLTTLAHRLAAKVKQTGRVVTLNPMSPRDRRIVHIALQADPAVATRSQGEGQYRKILIVPAERARGGRQRRSEL